MAWLSLIIGGILLLILARPNYKKKTKRYLTEQKTVAVEVMGDGANAINLAALSDESVLQKIGRIVRNFWRQLGVGAPIKLPAYLALLSVLSVYISDMFQLGLVPILIEVWCLGLYLAYVWLQKRERKRFENEFPDALNILTSAVSSGESLMHAIIYVGKTLEGDVGREFSLMGERLQVGEPPDAVFRKACRRFPYPAFYFFVITMRANMQRGGQLKDIMTRLNRLMFDARTIEKKKYALTAEARTSAQIVGAIPFVFLVMLQYLSPGNFEYVMFNPQGRYILYYVLFSEVVGIAIIWKLMRGVSA
jgi:tight adherence protein B